MSEHDFIARLADCWDGRGGHAFTPPKEHTALLRLAYLPETLATAAWSTLTPEQRHKLLFAAKSAVDLGALCAWVLGPVKSSRARV